MTKYIKIKSIMKKLLKKTSKEAPVIVDSIDKCPKCLGTGLWNPQFTHSPQCDECHGEGIVK